MMMVLEKGGLCSLEFIARHSHFAALRGLASSLSSKPQGQHSFQILVREASRRSLGPQNFSQNMIDEK